MTPFSSLLMASDAPIIESGLGPRNSIGFGSTRRHEFVSQNSNMHGNNMKLFNFDKKGCHPVSISPLLYAYQRVQQDTKFL